MGYNVLEDKGFFVPHTTDKSQSTTVPGELRTRRAARESIHKRRSALGGEVGGENGIGSFVHI